MLQWMGGSRHKVNASRASKQKRQKQYFEQRKRQQHQHINSYADNVVGRYDACCQGQKEKRSLDVLSLHNLSQGAEGCRSASTDGILKDPLPEKCPKTRTLPTSINKTVTLSNDVEALKIRNISNNPAQRMPEEEFRIAASNLSNSTSKERNPKGEKLKHASGDKFEGLSVFELIDEDGKSSNNSEEKNEYEPHVAFSMQGLGKVEIKTPDNSPPQPSRRMPSDVQPGLFEAARHQYTCRNFDNLLEDHEMDMESMMEDGDMFSNDKYLSSDFRQSWRLGSYGPLKHDYLGENSTKFYDKNPKVKLFDDKEIFDDIQQMRANYQEVPSRFPVGSSFSEKFDMSEGNGCFTDVFNIRTDDADFNEDFTFAKSDQYGQTSRFCDLDFSSKYPKHQLAEDYDLLNSDDSNYFTANKFPHAGAKQSRCSYLKAEDPMDNFSVLSGESCSSSAVKGDDFIGAHATRKSDKRRSAFIGVPSKPQSIAEDFYRQPATSIKFIPGQQGECERPRAYARRSCDPYPLRSVSAEFTDFSFGETFGQVDDDWSGKDGFPSTSIHLTRHTDFGSSRHGSGKDYLSRGCKPVEEDILGPASASNFRFDSHLSFGGCNDDSSVESATPLDLPSKKPAFCEDFFSFPENGCGKSRKGSSHQETGACVQSSNSTEVSGKHGDKDLLNEQSSSHRNAQCESFKEKASYEKEIHAGPEGKVPEILNPLRQTNETLSKKNLDIKRGFIQDYDTSSYAGLSDNSGSRASEKECPNNSFDLQRQQLDSGTPESDQKNISSDGEDSSIEPSYQVMMLESHMLQLLCVKRSRKFAQKEDIRRRT